MSENQRIDWSKVGRKPRPYAEFTVQDANIGTVTISLRKLKVTELDAAEENARELIAKYVTGGFYNDAEVWCNEPIKFPEIDGESPVLTATTLRKMARIELMQPEAGRHTLKDLIFMEQLSESAYEEIGFVADGLQAGSLKPKEEQGNAQGEVSQTPPAG
jgi:hypothetical protein